MGLPPTLFMKFPEKTGVVGGGALDGSDFLRLPCQTLVGHGPPWDTFVEVWVWVRA